MNLEVQIDGNKIYVPLKNKWLILKPEETVRQEYICHLVNIYGYSLEQMSQEEQVNNSKRGQGKARADIVIWKTKDEKNNRKKPVIVVECKAEHITIREEDYFQGFNYASWAGAKFFVTTNLKDTKFFRINEDAMPDELDEIIEIPKASELDDDKIIQELLNQTKVFTRDEFSKLLFKCHNIIRNNDKLSPEAAFDEISKILFIKIRYERKQAKVKGLFSKKQFEDDRESYTRTASSKSLPFYQSLFERTKEDFKEDEIFDTNDTIKIKENSFLQIVKELEKYNLSDTSDDVKGIAFEQFLGRTFRGELGQFFTPRTIVDFMVDVLEPQEGETICDPACGSGGFLINAFEYVREKIEKNLQVEKDKLKKLYYTDDFDSLSENEQEKINSKVNDLFVKLNYELELKNKNGRLRRLSYDCIFGTDANPRMARTAKMNMIMHGDGHGGVHHHDGLLNVNGIFENRFDVIFTNPPFGSRVEKNAKITEEEKFTDKTKIMEYQERFGVEYLDALRQVNDNIGKSILSLFDLGSSSGLTEVLFMERCLRLLRKGGRMGIVLPEGVLNNANLQKIRDYFESKAKILFIVSIPQDVFIASGATVKPSLLFFKKFTEKEENEYAKIKDNVTKQSTLKYSNAIELANIDIVGFKTNNKKDNKSATYKKKLKELEEIKRQVEEQMENEIKREVKKLFDYEIPVAEVEKAGITSTGAKTDNELEPLAKEFTEYRKKKKLWRDNYLKVGYELFNNKEYMRVIAGEKQEIYG